MIPLEVQHSKANRPMASKPATKTKPAAAPAKKPGKPVTTAAKKPAATAARTATPKTAPKVTRAATPKKSAETVTLKTVFEQLAEAQAMTKKQALTMATGMVDLVTGILRAGNRVRLSGLGILEVKDRPARMGRNPATGAAVQIAASKKIAFRAAKELKEAV
jgi:DNA-binding protein HU-beta